MAETAEPFPATTIIGIDLGTTNSLVAVTERGVPVVLPDEQGHTLLASVVYFPVDGSAPVVGEAARHIPAEVETRHSELPWHRMRGLRNVLVHEYFGVSLTTVWETATRNLPPLVPQLRRILEEEQS